MICKSLILIFCATLCGANIFADSEECIALFPETETRMYNIAANRRYRKNPDMKIAALRKVIQQFSTVDAAPKAAMQILEIQLKRKKYKEVLVLAEEFLKNYPNYRSNSLSVSVKLTQLIRNKKLPPEIRLKAFEILLPNIKGIGYHCASLRNWLDSRKEITPKAKFELMVAAASVADGGNDPSGVARYFATKLLNTSSDNKEKIAICEKYLKSFSKESLMYLHAKEKLLSLKATDGDAKAKLELKELKSANSAASKIVAGIFKSALKLLDDKKYDKAVEELEKLKKEKIPRPLTINGWSKISGKLKPLSPDTVLKLFKLACETTHPRGINNNYLNCFANSAFYATPTLASRTISLIDEYFTTFTDSDVHANHIINFIRNRMVRSLAGETKAKLFYTLAKVAGKHGLNNLRSQYLYTAGIAILGNDPKRALKYFEHCVATGASNKRVAQAKWLTELLTGQKSLSQSASPRFLPERLSFKSAPKMRMRLNKVTPQSELQHKRGYYSLASQQVELNRASVVCDETKNKTVKNAFDGSAETAWIPKKAPATLLVPLKCVSTLNRIKITSEYGFEYTVKLVDKTGRYLREFERVRLKIHAGNYYSPAVAEIKFTPCDNVAAIRIDVYRRMGKNDGIGKIEASGPAYAMRTVKRLPVRTIPAGKKSISLSYDLKIKSATINYGGKFVHFYRRQWFDPWRMLKYFRMSGLDFSLGIYGGENLTLHFSHKGAVNWLIDGNEKGRVENSDKEKEKILLPKLSEGLHLLNFSGSSLPVGNDVFGADAMQFKGVSVKGNATGEYIVRFKISKGWSKLFGATDSWTGWFKGKNIRIPAGAKSCQLAAVLDSREVLGAETAELGDVKVSFSDSEEKDDVKFDFKERTFIRDDVPGLVKYIKENRPAIVFSKNGTKAEYEMAKELADKVGCYLISDDVEFNNRREKGPILAIGTPLINRYCRALISRLQVWSDEQFLNSSSGFAAPPPNTLESDTNFAFITGDTPTAVIAALKRVISATSHFTSESQYRLFAVPLVERVYPWQLHQGAPKLGKLSIELALNDRRSVKAGITFNHSANKFKVVCDPLKSASGATLPPPRIRYTGYYEWSFFFGDVRVPDLLVEKTLSPMPANTASCVWLTVDTNNKMIPGIYRSKVRFIDGDFVREVPFEVRVLNLKIPNKRITSYDYSGVPYWFTPDTEPFWRVFRKLTRNRAKHGVNKIKILDTVKYELSNGKVTFDFTFPLKQMKIANGIFAKLGKGDPDFYYPAPTLTSQNSRINQKNAKTTIDDIREEYSKQLVATLKKRGL